MSTLTAFAHTLQQKLKEIQHITLISHQTPDGDALGSLEAMRGLLQVNHPHLTVAVVVPPEPLDLHISWLLGETVETIPTVTDCVLLLDMSLISRTKLPAETFLGHELLSIDHHEQFPESIPGYRDSSASSNTIILTELAETLDWTIEAQTATALLVGIYTDTGGFIHRNTDARALNTSARLLELGADHSVIAQKVFGAYTLHYLHQLGQYLGAIELVDRVAILCLPSDVEGGLKSHIIGYLSGLENVDIACTLYPEGSLIKGSLRTRYDTIDVNQIAQVFGGGGHKKAAGFRIEGTLEDRVITFDGHSYSTEAFVRQFISKNQGRMNNDEGIMKEVCF